ncbi:hypothetical protein [Flavobacterium sp.]|uniref:hypothetical protein n=1 Tax=Flavobacterium sp. TaxID=239 RepID=UPI0037522357
MFYKIKVGFLVSYDYKFLYNSIPLVYDYVDTIYLAIDVNRKTWSGELFTIDILFFNFITKLDKHKKIIIYEDDFYNSELTPIENDTRERNMLSKKIGKNCWNLQIDADEYFMDFAQVSRFLRKNSFLLSKPNHNPINLKAKWITIFKKTENGYLYIDNDESFSFATNQIEKYYFARNVNPSIRNLQTNFIALHQSWARDSEEILFKINNWGHKYDFDRKAYFKFWKNLNEDNYKDCNSFHYYLDDAWDSLKYIACGDISEFIEIFKSKVITDDVKVPTRFYKKYLKNLFLLKRN